jgi:SAM-dependent methyltransferase
VGCGDGHIPQRLSELRSDLELHGVEVFVRRDVAIPVERFDGRSLPHPHASFEAVIFVDVLHHTEDPMVLLREARRVCRTCIVIKDHSRDRFLAGTLLRWMDRVGNPPRGVAFPYNYWTRERWQAAFRELDLRVASWNERLRLFPPPAEWIFGGSLQFLARLDLP